MAGRQAELSEGRACRAAGRGRAPHGSDTNPRCCRPSANMQGGRLTKKRRKRTNSRGSIQLGRMRNSTPAPLEGEKLPAPNIAWQQQGWQWRAAARWCVRKTCRRGCVGGDRRTPCEAACKRSGSGQTPTLTAATRLGRPSWRSSSSPSVMNSTLHRHNGREGACRGGGGCGRRCSILLLHAIKMWRQCESHNPPQPHAAAASQTLSPKRAAPDDLQGHAPQQRMHIQLSRCLAAAAVAVGCTAGY